MAKLIEVLQRPAELSVNPEAPLSLHWPAQEHGPAPALWHIHIMLMLCWPISYTPALQLVSSLGAHIGIATFDNPGDKAPPVVVEVSFVIAPYEVMNSE